eukprot:TRINITY_DN1175_c0_g2_i1.p1 TRINITY_DN1175_c0_g2~~TRINITY_DN1175_c0_g2_i1.p1  ORF type:complete len:228 (+),score=13.74 TRINITY_DN1175_c0_g2_i1:133-816(+)
MTTPLTTTTTLDFSFFLVLFLFFFFLFCFCFVCCCISSAALLAAALAPRGCPLSCVVSVFVCGRALYSMSPLSSWLVQPHDVANSVPPIFPHSYAQFIFLLHIPSAHPCSPPPPHPPPTPFLSFTQPTDIVFPIHLTLLPIHASFLPTHFLPFIHLSIHLSIHKSLEMARSTSSRSRSISSHSPCLSPTPPSIHIHPVAVPSHLCFFPSYPFCLAFCPSSSLLQMRN